MGISMRRPNDNLPDLILSLFARIHFAANRPDSPPRSPVIETDGLEKMEVQYWRDLEDEIRDSRNT
jgi:hypothetical protein